MSARAEKKHDIMFSTIDFLRFLALPRPVWINSN